MWADIDGSTVILNGEIVDPKARYLIISSVLAAACVEQVIDSLRVSGEPGSTQVYMKNGDQLARMLQTYYGDELTWDQYKVARKRAKPT